MSEGGEVRLLPSAVERFDSLLAPLPRRWPALFLAWDGSLSSLVARQGDPVLSPGARGALGRLAKLCPVAVLSTLDATEVRDRLAMPEVACAGSDGLEILGPGPRRHVHEGASAYIAPLAAARRELVGILAGIQGVQIEVKRFAVVVHYRQVEPARQAEVAARTDAIVFRHPELRLAAGVLARELKPNLVWDKARAVRLLLRELSDPWRALPIYLGDQESDEIAFQELLADGLAVFVGPRTRPTAASHALGDHAEARQFIAMLAERAEAKTPPSARPPS